jgi:hypothetical protein
MGKTEKRRIKLPRVPIFFLKFCFSDCNIILDGVKYF